MTKEEKIARQTARTNKATRRAYETGTATPRKPRPPRGK